jgi:putative ABC transport system permease protein
MTLSRIKYPEAAKRLNFFQELNQRVASLPGVESVGLVIYLPLGGSNSSAYFIVDGLPEPPPGQEFSGRYRACTPGYFKAMGITVLSGRGFTEQDTATSQRVAIINETMAQQYWPDGDAVGKRFRLNGPIDQNPWLVIVGIIKDVKFELYSPVTSEYYLPAAQDVWSTMILVANTRSEPLALSSAIRGEVSSLDKDLPVFDIKTMEQVRSQSVLPYSFSGILLSIFAVVALVLASVGIYGVISYSVEQRTREIGIRMALGAKQGDVLKMVVRHGLTLTVIGLGIGSLGAWLLMRIMVDLLFGVSANDLTIFLSVPLILALVAFIACYIPARRAARVDPMVALRYE